MDWVSELYLRTSSIQNCEMSVREFRRCKGVQDIPHRPCWLRQQTRKYHPKIVHETTIRRVQSLQFLIITPTFLYLMNSLSLFPSQSCLIYKHIVSMCKYGSIYRPHTWHSYDLQWSLLKYSVTHKAVVVLNDPPRYGVSVPHKLSHNILELTFH